VTEAVVLSGATVRIAGRTILGPLDLSIGVGEHWVVLGPNGCGKTTALTLFGAWRQPSAGSVKVLGARLGRVDVRRLRHRIGHVSHAVAERVPSELRVLDTVLTGRDATLVTWWQRFGDDEIAAARELLARVGCASLAERPLASCSLGERQRVLIARALFGAHDLLLFDEPAAGLDLPARELLLAAMTAAASGIPAPTTVLATHHLEEIPETVSHAALLRDGLLVTAGPARIVLVDEALSACFQMPITVERLDGRWSARRSRR
jgi:iron complex transport system ATP-binding protein